MSCTVALRGLNTDGSMTIPQRVIEMMEAKPGDMVVIDYDQTYGGAFFVRLPDEKIANEQADETGGCFKVNNDGTLTIPTISMKTLKITPRSWADIGYSDGVIDITKRGRRKGDKETSLFFN